MRATKNLEKLDTRATFIDFGLRRVAECVVVEHIHRKRVTNYDKLLIIRIVANAALDDSTEAEAQGSVVIAVQIQSGFQFEAGHLMIPESFRVDADAVAFRAFQESNTSEHIVSTRKVEDAFFPACIRTFELREQHGSTARRVAQKTFVCVIL